MDKTIEKSLDGGGAVDEAIADYLARLDRGDRILLEELVADHPGCEQGLRDFLQQENRLHALTTESIPTKSLPGQILGDFRLLSELGRGGMGVVYEAEQLSLGRRVALKVLPFAAMLDKQQLARFKNEARAAATLDHAHIVAIHSVGSEDKLHYYAMQLIEGLSVAQAIAALRVATQPATNEVAAQAERSTANRQASTEVNPAEALAEVGPSDLPLTQADQSGDDTPCHSLPLPPFATREYYRAVARLGIEAASALDHAHQNGILHRDIKPGNLLLDHSGKLWVADFGLARIEADASMTMTGDLVGTLRYMSPEQAQGQRAVVDHRSDLYSLGVTLYELLTLEPAFGETDRAQLFQQIARDEPRSLRQHDPRIPRDLETIVLKGMQKSLADRYTTAGALADDLANFLGDKPINAKRPTWRDQTLKWSRRHVAAIWYGLAVTLAISVVLLVSTMLVVGWYREATIQRSNAERETARAESALQQSEENLNAATEHRDRAQAVTDFVTSSLRAHSPHSDGRQDITVADAMMQAVERIDQGELADQPERVAHLLEHIAMILHENGRTAEAVPLAERSLQLRRDFYGNDHETVSRSLNNLAGLQMTLGRFAEAEAVFDEVVERYERLYAGVDHPHRAMALMNLAGVRQRLGRLAEAAPLFERALGMVRRQYADQDNATVVRGLINLAGIRRDLGESDEAHQLYNEALAMSKRLTPGDHPVTAICLSNLAGLHQDNEGPEVSAPLWEEALEMRKRLFQGDHPEVASSLNNLAWARWKQGRLAEAETLSQEALAMFQRLFPGDHPSVARCLTSLALVFEAQGRVNEAEVRLVEALAMANRILPADHEYVTSASESLVELREKRAQSGEAASDELAQEPVP